MVPRSACTKTEWSCLAALHSALTVLHSPWLDASLACCSLVPRSSFFLRQALAELRCCHEPMSLTISLSTLLVSAAVLAVLYGAYRLYDLFVAGPKRFIADWAAQGVGGQLTCSARRVETRRGEASAHACCEHTVAFGRSLTVARC